VIGIYRGKFKQRSYFPCKQLGDIICDLENKGGPMKKAILAAALCGAAVGVGRPPPPPPPPPGWGRV